MNGAQRDDSSDIRELQRKLLLHGRREEAEILAAKKTIREDLKTRIGEHLQLDTSALKLKDY